MKAKLIIAAIVMALAIAYNANADEIVTFKGSGTITTRPFNAEVPVIVSWDAKTSEALSLFQIYLYEANTGSIITVLANQSPADKGESYVARPGRYYLMINGTGKWVVTVEAAK